MTKRDFSFTEKKATIGRLLVTYPSMFCDPLIIGRHVDQVGHERADVWTASGTILALSAGLPMLVTNWHVLEIYRRKLDEDRRTIFQFLDQTFNPLDRLIDEDQNLDLAVIDISQLVIERAISDDTLLPQIQPLVPSKWPPDPVREGDIMIFGGWPEHYRVTEDGGRELIHRSLAFAGVPVTGAFGSHFSCRFDRTEWEAISDLPHDQVIQGHQLSGLSGGPIFRDRGAEGALALEIAGFVTEYHPEFDVLHGTAADNLRVTGTIWH